MSFANKAIINLLSTEGDFGPYPIQLVEDYGVVAPNLWTTNGSMGYTAGLVADYVSKNKFIAHSISISDGVDYTSKQSIFDAIKAEYGAWKAAGFPPDTHPNLK